MKNTQTAEKAPLNLILVKIASQCNINCSYCYIYNTGYVNSLANQPKFITEETILNLAKQLKEIEYLYDNSFYVSLHGGEPLLVGYDRLHFILDKLSEVMPNGLSIQTNGILLTPKILDLLHQYNCSIGISLDGDKSTNDKFRVYRSGKGSFDRVKSGLDLLLDHPLSEKKFSIIIAVIDPETDPIEVYEYLSQFKPNAIDFLFKDGYHEQLPLGKQSFQSIEYGAWLTKLAQYYLTLENPIPIRKIDSLIEAYIGNKLNQQTLFPFGMVTINPNGGMTKNELYDITPMGVNFSKSWNINSDSLLHLLMTDDYKSYTLDPYPNSATCLSCRHLNVCGGGNEVHARWDRERGINNPSIYCADYQYFFDNMSSALDNHLSTMLELAS